MSVDQQKFFAAFRKGVSFSRLDKYRLDASEDGAHVVARYTWNVLLSEAFYPVLQAIEIVFRNNVHDSLTHVYRTAAWFDIPNILHPPEIEQIQRAKDRLKERHKPIDSGSIIAELTFGFWTTFFNRRYKNNLFPKFIEASFPYLERKHRRRDILSPRFEMIRTLRNRVFHHEPIWNRPHLKQEHANSVEAIGWMNREIGVHTAAVDRFKSIFEKGIDPLTDLIKEIH